MALSSCSLLFQMKYFFGPLLRDFSNIRSFTALHVTTGMVYGACAQPAVPRFLSTSLSVSYSESTGLKRYVCSEKSQTRQHS